MNKKHATQHLIKLQSLWFVIFALFAGTAMAQQNTIKGVSIAYDTLPPHPSALLDVRAINKGILVPRMTAIERNNIATPAEGLTVFVADHGAEKGYWFWDSTTPGWRQLKAEHVYYPLGTIIMYSGDLANFDANGIGVVGTDKEGWAICNGYDSVPDLRGTFVVGGEGNRTDYNMLGKTGGTDNPVLTIAQMAEHNHTVNATLQNNIQIPHTHEIIDPGHDHGVGTTESADAGTGYIKRRDENDRESLGLGTSTTGITINKNEGPINFIFPTNLISTYGGGAAYDNRPLYYVLAYIIRTDGVGDFQTPKTIPYTKQ